MPKLKDFITAENELDGQEYVYISQTDKTRKTTIQKIKDFILGPAILTTNDKTMRGAVNEVNAQLSDIALYGATCAYASNVFTLTLNKPQTTLPNFYTVRFKVPSAWIEGATFKIGTKTYTPANANFNADDVVIMNFDEISGKCFSTGAPKTVLPVNLVYATTTNMTLYVATTGSDITGVGSQIKPFATIQKAIDSLPAIINHNITINVSQGTYNETVNINKQGTGSIVLSGGVDTTTAENFIVNGFKISGSINGIFIIGFKAIRTDYYRFLVDNSSSFVRFVKCVSNVLTSWAGFAVINASAMVQIQNCISSNSSTSAIYNASSIIIISQNNTGSGNAVGLMVESGVIAKNGTQPSGTTAELQTLGGAIR